MVIRYSTVAELLPVIERGDVPCRDLVLASLRRLNPEDPIPLLEQPAARTASTLRIKYTLVEERGIEVCGLDVVVDGLHGMGSSPMFAVPIDDDSMTALVALREDMSLIGIICVKH